MPRGWNGWALLQVARGGIILIRHSGVCGSCIDKHVLMELNMERVQQHNSLLEDKPQPRGTLVYLVFRDNE